MFASCPVCGSTNDFGLADISSMPVYCNVLQPGKQAALEAATGDIRLVYCLECSHIFNKSFEPEKMAYSVAYENSLHYSNVFNAYSESLAQELVDHFNLQKRNIVEIGCGKGDFLNSICEKGDSRGYGFDKSFDADRFDKAEMPNITIRQEFYSSEFADVPVEFMCSRHVLEHIQFPVDFLKMITSASSAETNFGLYLEVPNGLFTLRDFGVWDIIYEHCSYFTPVSLAEAFERAGCGVSELEESFSGQFLSLKGSRYKSETVTNFNLNSDERKRKYFEYAAAFNQQYELLRSSWLDKLTSYSSSGKKVVIWGAGSKGVTFLNIFKSLPIIEYAVDLNPHKVGMFVPGGGQEVVAPDFLRNYNPDVIIVMNPVYRDEIAKQAASLGVKAEVVVV